MRTSDPDLPVAPAPRCRRSTTMTRRTPRLVRLKAVLAPLTPPPMMTTSAFSIGHAPPRGIVRDGRCDCGTLDRSPGRPYKVAITPPWQDQPCSRTNLTEVQPMQVTRRELLKGAAALGVAGALPQELPGAAQAQTTQKKELVTAQGGDIAKFDPHFSTASQDIRVSFNLFDNLTSRHPDGKLYPGLATEWKLQAETTWRFKLRQGVKFHNGDPFTSADAKFSVERTYAPAVKTMVSTALATIDRIEAPDPYTLVIHTKKPDPLLAARLAFYGGQIVPKKYLESVGNDGFNAKPVGTGPVRFVSWTKDDRLTLEGHPDYFGGRPHFERLIVRAIPETSPRVAALLKGEVDIITQLPPDQGQRVNGNGSTRVAGALYGGLYVLAVNSKRPPLDNPLVKQALSLAIDRELIVKELWKGRGIVPNGPIAKGDNHYDPKLAPLAYNPNEARERLKKAGYK